MRVRNLKKILWVVFAHYRWEKWDYMHYQIKKRQKICNFVIYPYCCDHQYSQSERDYTGGSCILQSRTLWCWGYHEEDRPRLQLEIHQGWCTKIRKIQFYPKPTCTGISYFIKSCNKEKKKLEKLIRSYVWVFVFFLTPWNLVCECRFWFVHDTSINQH